MATYYTFNEHHIMDYDFNLKNLFLKVESGRRAYAWPLNNKYMSS